MGSAAFFLPVILPFFVAGAVEGVGVAIDALANAAAGAARAAAFFLFFFLLCPCGSKRNHWEEDRGHNDP